MTGAIEGESPLLDRGGGGFDLAERRERNGDYFSPASAAFLHKRSRESGCFCDFKDESEQLGGGIHNGVDEEVHPDEQPQQRIILLKNLPADHFPRSYQGVSGEEDEDESSRRKGREGKGLSLLGGGGKWSKEGRSDSHRNSSSSSGLYRASQVWIEERGQRGEPSGRPVVGKTYLQEEEGEVEKHREKGNRDAMGHVHKANLKIGEKDDGLLRIGELLEEARDEEEEDQEDEGEQDDYGRRGGGGANEDHRNPNEHLDNHRQGGGGRNPPIEAFDSPPYQRSSHERQIIFVFCLMFVLEIFVNFDSGVVPAILATLQEQFNIDGAAAGLLGSLPYIGLVASSPFVGRGLTTFSPKWFCFITMVVNLLATGLLGLAYYKWMLFLSRLLIGLSQSGFSIYAPVWVDQFAPAEQLTLWMGLAQGGVVVGTMLGCVIAGSFDTAQRNGVEGLSWRYALLIQAIFLFLLLSIWLFLPRRFVDINMKPQALPSPPTDEEEEEAVAETAACSAVGTHDRHKDFEGLNKEHTASDETMATLFDGRPTNQSASLKVGKDEGETGGDTERGGMRDLSPRPFFGVPSEGHDQVAGGGGVRVKKRVDSIPYESGTLSLPQIGRFTEDELREMSLLAEDKGGEKTRASSSGGLDDISSETGENSKERGKVAVVVSPLPSIPLHAARRGDGADETRARGRESRRLSLGAVFHHPVVIGKRTHANEEDEEDRRGDLGGGHQTGIRGHRRSKLHSTESFSCDSLPQFRKELISNLLPLDFIATSPTFTRRSCLAKPGPAPGSLTAAAAGAAPPGGGRYPSPRQAGPFVGGHTGSSSSSSPGSLARPLGDLQPTGASFLDPSDSHPSGASYDNPSLPLSSSSSSSHRLPKTPSHHSSLLSSNDNELTTVSRLGPPPSSSTTRGRNGLRRGEEGDGENFEKASTRDVPFPSGSERRGLSCPLSDHGDAPALAIPSSSSSSSSQAAQLPEACRDVSSPSRRQQRTGHQGAPPPGLLSVDLPGLGRKSRVDSSSKTPRGTGEGRDTSSSSQPRRVSIDEASVTGGGGGAGGGNSSGNGQNYTRGSSGVSEVQYQMTFFTPHSTTLAFEAFNWAAGTADPLLLVRTDAVVPPPPPPPASSCAASSSSSSRPGVSRGDRGSHYFLPSAGAEEQGRGRSGCEGREMTRVSIPDIGAAGVLPHHRRRSTASSSMSENAHAGAVDASRGQSGGGGGGGVVFLPHAPPPRGSLYLIGGGGSKGARRSLELGGSSSTSSSGKGRLGEGSPGGGLGDQGLSSKPPGQALMPSEEDEKTTKKKDNIAGHETSLNIEQGSQQQEKGEMTKEGREGAWRGGSSEKENEKKRQSEQEKEEEEQRHISSSWEKHYLQEYEDQQKGRRRSSATSSSGTGGGGRRITALVPVGGAVEYDLDQEGRGVGGAAEALTVAPRTFGVWQSISILFESPVYVCVTIALCALFFEVTAIQFWSITYFQQELKVPGAQVLVAFNATAATAPILGVLAGGWFIDYVGGYKNERGMMKTLMILDFWAMLCLFFGVCACFVRHFIVIICFIWCILFFGGGILPAATGIVIASVPLEVRAFGSGFCMMIYNVFGYVIGTLVPGAIIQAAGLTWGMRVVFLWSIFGVSGLGAAAFVVWRLRIKPAYVSYEEQLSPQEKDEGRLVQEDFMLRQN